MVWILSAVVPRTPYRNRSASAPPEACAKRCARERKLSSTRFRTTVLGLATRTLLKVFATIGTLVMTMI